MLGSQDGQTVRDHHVTHSFDAMGRETSSVHSIEGTTTTQFDAAGNETASRSPQASGWQRTAYDAEGHETSSCATGDTSATVTTYFPNGLTKRVTEPDGSWTEYTYDDGGNKTAEMKPSGEGTATSTFTYDVAGRLISSSSPEVSTTDYT
jgi:YD repeat-containing protein